MIDHALHCSKIVTNDSHIPTTPQAFMGFGELASTGEARERDDGNESVERERGVNPFVPAFLNN